MRGMEWTLLKSVKPVESFQQVAIIARYWDLAVDNNASQGSAKGGPE